MCKKCKETIEQIELENERVRVENDNRKIKEIRVKKELKFQKAIEEKKWLNLNDYEFEILQKILQSLDLRIIKRDVFEGNFYDKRIWAVVNKLERYGLIQVERNEWNGSVSNFSFDQNLQNHITKPVSSRANNYLSFSLIKKDNKTNVKQPDYSGTFTLPTNIILKAGVKYIYGGWIQTDNSINLKFTPLSEIETVKQTDIENEPQIVKDILKTMFSTIEPNEKNEPE